MPGPAFRPPAGDPGPPPWPAPPSAPVRASAPSTGGRGGRSGLRAPAVAQPARRLGLRRAPGRSRLPLGHTTWSLWVRWSPWSAGWPWSSSSAMLRDWVRAVACAAAPVLAVLIVQDLAKPLVGRHLGITGGASYPSGTVAAVAALMTAAALVAPAAGPPAGGGGRCRASPRGCAPPSSCCGGTIRPTRSAGVAVGVGAVLALDALAHLPWAGRSALRRGRGSPRRIGPGRRPRWA